MVLVIPTRLGARPAADRHHVIPAMTTRAKAWLLVVAIAVAVAVYYPFSPGGRQSANMRKAEEHAAMLKPKLAADVRWKDVDLLSLTARGGCLQVAGEVPTKADVEELRSIVNGSNPPVEVMFHVSAREGAATRPQGYRPRGDVCRCDTDGINNVPRVFRQPVAARYANSLLRSSQCF